MHEDTVCLLVRQKKLKDDYENANVWPRINTSDMEGMMESIKKYLRSCHGKMRAPLAYIIRKTIIVQTDGDYLMYATPDDEMIARMLHLPPEKNKLLGCVTQSAKEVQQSTRLTTKVSMTSWIRSARTFICIHIANSRSARGTSC